MSSALPISTTPRLRGRYLYAVTEGVPDQHQFSVPGMEASSLYAIGDVQVAAIVSDVPNQQVRPERKRLASHHNVLKNLMLEHTVLPMAFGIIADGSEAVRRILRKNRDSFESELERVRGKVEMGLRVVWDVPNFFEYFIDVHPELRMLRDHLFRGGNEPSHAEKIELGRAFDRLLSADRAQLTEKLVHGLRDLCAEIVDNPPKNEHEVMNLACLVERDRQKEFEQAVIEAARLFDNNYAFDINGPWPPHNFVELQLEL
jgi:gas vesicle protein GvpL/GvpF